MDILDSQLEKRETSQNSAGPEKRVPIFRGYSVSNPNGVVPKTMKEMDWNEKKTGTAPTAAPASSSTVQPAQHNISSLPGMAEDSLPVYENPYTTKSKVFISPKAVEKPKPIAPNLSNLEIRVDTLEKPVEKTGALDKLYSANTTPAETLQPIPRQIPTASENFQPQQKNEIPAQTPAAKFTISPIRTFDADTAHAVKEKNASVIDIALAEQKKRRLVAEDDRTSIPFIRGFILVVISLALISAGALALFYYYKNSQVKPNPVVVVEQSAIPYDSKKNLAPSLDRQSIIKAVRKESETDMPDNNVEEIDIKEPALLGGNILTTEKLAQYLSMDNMPKALLRSLDQKFTLGIYSIGGKNSVFLVFKNNSYDISFAGMLSWEKDMAREIGPLFAGTSETTYSTSTATFGAELPPEITGAQFIDVVIKNRDARAVKDAAGNIVFLYSFIDKNTIVLAGSPEALDEVATRSVAAKFVR